MASSHATEGMPLHEADVVEDDFASSIEEDEEPRTEATFNARIDTTVTQTMQQGVLPDQTRLRTGPGKTHEVQERESEHLSPSKTQTDAYQR